MTTIIVEPIQLLQAIEHFIFKDPEDSSHDEDLKHVQPLLDQIPNSDKLVITRKIEIINKISYKLASETLDNFMNEKDGLPRIFTMREYIQLKRRMLLGQHYWERQDEEEDLMRRMLDEVDKNDFDARMYYIRKWEHLDYMWHDEDVKKALDWCNDMINSGEYTADQKYEVMREKLNVLEKLYKKNPDELKKSQTNTRQMMLTLAKDEFTKLDLLYKIIKSTFEDGNYKECSEFIEKYLDNNPVSHISNSYNNSNTELGHVLEMKFRIDRMNLK